MEWFGLFGFEKKKQKIEEKLKEEKRREEMTSTAFANYGRCFFSVFRPCALTTFRNNGLVLM